MWSLEHQNEKTAAVTEESTSTLRVADGVYDGDIYLGPSPTAHELQTLRKVAGSIAGSGYWLCAVEFAERASYYGCSWVFANFIQYPLPQGGNGAGAPPRDSEQTAGALGMGLQASSALTLLFQTLAYTIPILGGWWADAQLGRYATIVLGVVICGLAHVIMVAGAVPAVLQRGHGLPPFLVSVLLLAFGAGLFKPNICPTVIDQVTVHQPYVKLLKTGERVIVDPETTIQRLTLTFYALVNVGAFFGLATTYAEKLVGYWLAFLLPGLVYLLMPVILLFAYKRTVKVPPQGNVLGDVFRVLRVSFGEHGFRRLGSQAWFDAAKPSILARQGVHTIRGRPISWTDEFVEDVRRTVIACQIFAFYPLYALNDNGVGTIQNAQGGSMTKRGAPNDLISNFNPLTIIVFCPLFNYVLYPFLRQRRVAFGPIKRITLGFLLAAVGAAVGAILQWQVYATSPCGYYATTCEDEGKGVSPISIWAQTPIYVLSALSELFANVTAYELAYARSPRSMRGLVSALFLAATAVSAAIGQAVLPALQDPYLIWPYVGTAVPGFLAAFVFYFMYRHIDDESFLWD
ncbi:hypothetical protein ASPZODRAFT_152832 [Penicilliopsis zonata CBS 506.65]|uniref:Major facilitator superfamily (MFS) profile domain-containing protein n=1 Tax=Penicilliopsis zonata CBS 506.65 TaxID=1073090 RepID=A0A1L9SFA7_9EURO|nr:hypothetical protein ASPZODRAFT_152832 [Penicilliopsis zonata CBS 506.65]OJJ45859.1 hypothetical protein ASPZODRAFT_152832 [Penicilliopsis zonata CBS 506.65]